MTIAHLDSFLALQNIPLFIIGRLAFPIFAFLIANGAYYSKDLKKYTSRILLFAVISQVPYILVQRTQNPDFWELNILFTLLFGLSVILIYKSSVNVFIKWAIIISVLLAADFLRVDYGLPGVLAVLFFFIFYKNKIGLVISQVAIFILLHAIYFPSQEVLRSLSPYYLLHTVPLALLALVPIYFYNGQEGRKMKYLFYIYYPLHLAAIYLLLTFIQNQ